MAAPLPEPSVNIYGTNAADTKNYGQLNKQPGQQVTSADWRLVEAAVNQERVRRGVPANAVITSRFTGFIEAADLNYLKTAVEVQGAAPNPPSYTFTASGGTAERPNLGTAFFVQAPIYYGGFQGVDKDRPIEADEINAMVDKVNGAGAVCVCNCNYCTCNCNYCTCNCNYSCTCNCNYSDIRLKTSVEFLYTVEDVKVYSFAYIWNTAKKYIGVMAQDLVGTKYENALSKDQSGHYMVDYTKLPVKMIEA